MRDKKRREEEERPVCLFHVCPVLLVNLAGVSDVRFPVRSEAGHDGELDGSYKPAHNQTGREV